METSHLVGALSLLESTSFEHCPRIKPGSIKYDHSLKRIEPKQNCGATGQSSLRKKIRRIAPQSYTFLVDEIPPAWARSGLGSAAGWSADRWCTPACECLHQASARKDCERLTAALNSAAPYTRKHGIDESDGIGRTAAMVAAWCGDLAVLRLLVETGARLGLQDASGRSALHWAAINRQPGALSMLRYLCGCNVDALLRDRYGQTCLHKAVECRNVKAAEVLVAAFPRLCVVEDRRVILIPPRSDQNRKELTQVVLEFFFDLCPPSFSACETNTIFGHIPHAS